MLRIAVEGDARAELAVGLDQICREGARRMLATALGLEVDAYIAAVVDECDERGHRLVVRNGHAARIRQPPDCRRRVLNSVEFPVRLL
jgi:hypothetical protein